MRLLVTGDRHWTDNLAVGVAFALLDPKVVIHGGAKGADSIANFEAYRQHIPTIQVDAEWHLYGRAAGPIRNRRMVNEFKPTHVMYCHDNLPSSRGTADMVKYALSRALPVAFVRDVVAHGGWPEGDIYEVPTFS